VSIFYPDGRHVHTYSIDTTAGLGLKSIVWAPSAQFLAIGGYDQRVRLVNGVTWSVACEFIHGTSVGTGDVWIETDGAEFYNTGTFF
jgi:hypothetical protein